MLNKVVLQGRLTKDPESRATASGMTVTGICVAVQRPVGKDKEKQADFINCVAFGKTAELLTRHFNKGKEIALVGSLRNETWERQDGTKQIMTKVYISEIYFVGFGESKSTPKAVAETPEDFIQADDIQLPF